MKLAKVPFDKLAAGVKTVESRLYDDKRRGVAVGDEIVFRLNENPEVTVTRRVVSLHVYPNFRSMMADLPAGRFGWDTAEEATAEIERHYFAEDQEKFGVIGIGLG